MACKRITGEDGTYHNNLVYFYKKIVDVGYTYYVYTARPKTKGGSGTPYKYVQWLKSLTFTDGGNDEKMAKESLDGS